MRNWNQRTREIAYLLNPAFCGRLLYAAIKEYEKKTSHEFPFPLTYLILPLVLHKQTRDAINSRIMLPQWVQTNQQLLIGFGRRTKDLVLITKNGMSIKFKTDTITPIGRVAMGVKGIALKEDDEVVAGLPVHKETDVVGIFTEGGLGRKTALEEFPIQNRGGKGTIAYKPTESSGAVVGALMLSDEDNVLISGNYSSICISAVEVPLLGKTSTGNIMIKNNKVLSVTKI